MSLFTAFFKKSVFFRLSLFFLVCLVFFAMYFAYIFFSLPKILDLRDYQPPLVSEVYDREGRKVGEFFKQRRILFPYEDIPDHVIWAFVSAEDGSFFRHKGLNFRAIGRAFIANLKAGRKVQGGSTITQQLARMLLLTSKKTYTRKLKEAILAIRMEASLSKQDILYIYLNHIYLGHGVYGLELASRVYFRKSVKDISLPEAAILAGLPKAPSRFSPVFYPSRAKSRQIYVLRRMYEEGYISEEGMHEAGLKEIPVFLRKDFSIDSPFYMETVRRLLLKHLGGEDLLSSGLKIHTSMDLNKQKQARLSLRKGLEDLDKRRGFRGVEKNLKEEDREEWKKERDKKLRSQIRKKLLIPGLKVPVLEDGEKAPDSFLKEFDEKFEALEARQNSLEFWKEGKKDLEHEIFEVVIEKVEEERIFVETPWGEEVIDIEDFEWAVLKEKKEEQELLASATEIFKKSDIIKVKLIQKEEEEEKDEKDKDPFRLSLYQEPEAEGSLLSFDMENEEIVALVGGYDFSRSEFNRVWQAKRQSGSVFKPFVYGAALERGLSPRSPISDTPLVFSKKEAEEKKEEEEEEEEFEVQDMWRPSNITNRYLGKILFRKALVRSLNIPTIRIIKRIGLDWTRFYVRSLGIFSPLNSDYTMALGSSSVSLYEILKAFSVILSQGKKVSPILVTRIEDFHGEEILKDLSLDEFFEEEILERDEYLEEEKERWIKNKRTDFQKRWAEVLEDPDTLIPPSNSYVLLNLLEGVIKDLDGTGGRARVLEFPVAGKTGTTDGYYDTWFVGGSSYYSTGIWIGHDKEKTLGKGETGSKTTLPAWIDYMEEIHKDLDPKEFPVPEGVVFSNIDAETGLLVSSESSEVFSQAFLEGSEPKLEEQISKGRIEEDLESDDLDFLKEDL